MGYFLPMNIKGILVLRTIGLFAIILFFPGCNPTQSEGIDFRNFTLSFNMTDEEIESYWNLVDSLIDRESRDITLSGVSEERFQQIREERSDPSRFFDTTIRVRRPDGTHAFSRTPVRPDGYVDFSNFHFRGNPENRVSIEFAGRTANPLKISSGFVITQKDIPVYHSLSKEKAGLLRAGTVIRIDRIRTDGYSTVVQMWDLAGAINTREIDFINYLNSIVSYRIINDRLYRFIYDQQMEVHINQHGFLEDGYRYIRNTGGNVHPTDIFFFWETTGDYIFDANGEFIEIREFGPSYLDK